MSDFFSSGWSLFIAAVTIGGLIAHEMGHVPRRGEQHVIAGLRFVVLHTKGGAVKWFKVSPAARKAAPHG